MTLEQLKIAQFVIEKELYEYRTLQGAFGKIYLKQLSNALKGIRDEIYYKEHPEPVEKIIHFCKRCRCATCNKKVDKKKLKKKKT